MKHPLFFALWALASLQSQAGPASTPAATGEVITVTAQNPLDGPFLGFGAEWDTMAYGHFKVGEEDFALIKSRLAWMKMPVVRAMMVTGWCYLGDDRYDFDSPAMRLLYRQLDVCEELGIQVVLTEWGLNQTWLKAPGLTGVTDPKYAEVIGTYLNHLLNVKKYTCIRTFIFMNEPEWMAGDKSLGLTHEQARDTWHQGLKNVLKQLDARGLRSRLVVAGPDQSGNRFDWLASLVRTAPGDFDAYELHLYANQRRQYPTLRDAADSGLVREFFSKAWKDVRLNDPDKTKPLLIGEAGFASWPPEVEKPFSAGSNAFNRDWRYGLYMTQYAIQAVEAGTWGILAWMLDDSSHVNFNWGMWGNKNEGFALKPWFYTWALLTRAFPADSTFSLLDSLPSGVEGLAARIPGDKTTSSIGWSFVLANTSDTTTTASLSLPAGVSPSLARYLYAENSAQADGAGLPLPVETIAAKAGAALPLILPAHSVTFVIPSALAPSK